MYSLYRAWFGDSDTSENYPRLQEALSPPDTVVRVGNEGEHQFVAHKGVLAAHSGYLKALLANATAANTASELSGCGTLPTRGSNVAGQATRQPVTSVSVSSIGGEAFAPLLNYMYTGRLEVTLDNVYSVLLATHLLHMPGALEQCRAALLRLRGPPHLPTPMPVATTISIPTSGAGSCNILRPIPNRLMVGPSMCWPTSTPLYPPTAPAPPVGMPHLPQLQPSVLIPSTVPPTVSLIPTMHETSSPSHYSTIEVPSPKSSPSQLQRSHTTTKLDISRRARSPPSNSSTSLPFVAAAAAAFSAFAASSVISTRIPSPSQSSSPAPSSSSHSPTLLRRSKNLVSSERNKELQDDSNLARVQPPHRRSSNASAEESTSQNRENDGDVASANENRSSRRRGRVGTTSSNDDNNVLSVVYDIACCDGPVRFQRVLNENYTSTSSNCITYTRVSHSTVDRERVSSESDENGGPPKPTGSCEPTESTSGNNTASYTCEYCRHTFKSQYCYKKHAKRHLLPARQNEANRQRQESARNRREVKLLDLNVQYYPCKICGCKFPSYYFVHKHRKLCHGNVDERSQTGSTISSPSHEQESTASTISDAPRD